jgi:hypothetical protein
VRVARPSDNPSRRLTLGAMSGTVMREALIDCLAELG